MEKIKELFFTQYYGQKLQKPEPVSDLMVVNLSNVSTNYLLLRTVDQLTDEHAMQLAFILNPECFNIDDEITVQRYPEFITMYSNGEQVEINTNFTGDLFTDQNGYSFNSKDCYKCYQLLIRWGYLIEFTYLEDNKPVTLQPDEIIAKGWAKIREV